MAGSRCGVGRDARKRSGQARAELRNAAAADPGAPARKQILPTGARRGPPPRSAAERGPAILKSGVIDGMPYTLYADGSIEAELPQGTVKFASVDALRSHLEKQS